MFRPRPIHFFMISAALFAALSTIAVGPNTADGVFALIDRFGVLPFILLASAPACFATGDARQFFVRTFTVFGLYLAVESMAQLGGVSALVWPHYILDPHVGIHADRARGPFVEGVANGLALTYCAALAGLCGFVDRRRAWRVAGRCILVLCLVGVLLTLTRAAWLGAAIALVAAIIAVPRFRGKAVWALSIVAAVLALVYVSVPGLADAAGARADDQLPLYDRLNTNAAAIRMFLQYPLAGIGWNESLVRMAEFVRQGADYPLTTASGQIEIHNVFLSRLAELGAVGFALWAAALLGATLFPLWRKPEASALEPWRVVLLIVVISWGTAALTGPMPYTQPNYIVWLVGGIVLVDYQSARRCKRRPT